MKNAAVYIILFIMSVIVILGRKNEKSLAPKGKQRQPPASRATFPNGGRLLEVAYLPDKSVFISLPQKIGGGSMPPPLGFTGLSSFSGP